MNKHSYTHWQNLSWSYGTNVLKVEIVMQLLIKGRGDLNVVAILPQSQCHTYDEMPALATLWYC